VATVLIGFMGAGKTTLARRLGGVDTDDLLGEPAETLFDRVGEDAFRAREEEAVLEALAAGHDVIALGGGACGSEAVGAALSDHTVVWLDVDLDTAWERAAGQNRPLARDRDTFAARFAERRAGYEELADVVFGRRPTPREGDFVLTDEHVGPLYAPDGFAIPAGEEHKTLATAELVWTEMVRRGTTRAGRLVAVGGGVVGDVGGFCAATYQRGIPVVQVPTTLVAQVDSAYGGKTGVDLPEAKNYVGAYHQPEAVYVDTAVLETLPAEERAAGYAEVVKTALIAGGALWDRVRAGAVDDDEVVLLCALTKLRIVAADERDAGVRQILNLGHTVGHAIEVAAGYGTYRHGEAVALGMLAALRLSGQDTLREEVGGLLAAQGLPTRLERAAPDDVVAATRLDKKRTGADVPFVLVEAVGNVTPGHSVGDADLRAAVQELAA
jgi:shikimate kinase/3-dehydroquinate synthase